MIENGVTDSVVEQAMCGRLESLGYMVKHGPESAPGELGGAKKE